MEVELKTDTGHPYKLSFCAYKINNLQAGKNAKNYLKQRLFLDNALPRARGLLRSV
jgi:hypothetical protein